MVKNLQQARSVHSISAQSSQEGIECTKAKKAANVLLSDQCTVPKPLYNFIAFSNL